MRAYDVYGNDGYRWLPSGATPRIIAFAKSCADQFPMPSDGSEEMFGGTKVPKAVTSGRPPASSSLASPSAPARAWQEAHPPAQNMRSPRDASPVPSAATVA